MKRKIIIFSFLIFFSSFLINPNWIYHSEILLSSPDHLHCAFITADDTRKILYFSVFAAADGHNHTTKVYRVNDLFTGTPIITEIYSHSTTENDCGVCGLAMDDVNNILYLSGDSSSTGGKWIDRIHNPDSVSPTIESDWLTPSYRVTGCDLYEKSGEYYLAVGDLTLPGFHIYKVSDKSEVQIATMGNTYARDVVFSKYSENLYANRNGNLHKIEGDITNGYPLQGTDIIECGNTVMQDIPRCAICITGIREISELVYNSSDGVLPGDKLYATYLDSSGHFYYTVYPTTSPTNTEWQFVSDAACLLLGEGFYEREYIAVLDDGPQPRIVLFRNWYPFADKGWDLYKDF